MVDRGQGSVRAAEKRALQAQAYQAAVRTPAAARIGGMRQEVEARQRALEDYTKRADVAGDEMLQEAQAGYLAGRFSVLELADASMYEQKNARRAAGGVSILPPATRGG